jgi:MoaA/NifB/PqqE/SkfB family radical SAM enzyme
MRVFEPNTVTILPTNKCTAACRHCSMNSGPDRSDTLSWTQLENILTQLFAETRLSVVVFSGGESTLLGEDLLKALRLCKQNGVLTRLVTNAFWATSEEAALAKLTELRQAGLDELNISTDDYHLPYISLQRVRWAFEAARKLDFMSISICNAYGPESWLTPERLNQEFGGGKDLAMRFDANGRSMQHQRREGETLVLLSNGTSMQLGRGINGLRESEVQQTPNQELTKLAEEIGGCPWAIRSASVSSKGHFVACCGFEVEDNPILDYGDLKEHSLKELIDRADNDLITNMIAILGPVKLKEMLEEICPDEVSFPRRSYRGYCEVCEDLTKIAKNREALYKYQGMFVDAVVKVREAYAAAYTGPDGKVRIPAGTNLRLQFSLVKPEEVPEGNPLLQATEAAPPQPEPLISLAPPPISSSRCG